MNADGYLARIGLSPPIETNVGDLERLQRAHLTAIPFENLDVFARTGVGTGEEWSVPKIVDRGRGGWCFELNTAFAWLLTRLGFRVRRLAATVLLDGVESPMPTHLTLEVALDRPYLVDVGFGDSFIKPLPLDSEGPHDGGTGLYGFVFGEQTTLVAHSAEEAKPQYRFGPDERLPADFDLASTYLQVTPGLRWTKSRFATRLLENGPDRVTLVEDRLKLRRDGVWTEVAVTPDDWPGVLDEWFAMKP